jgi:hypothetical protein
VGRWATPDPAKVNLKHLLNPQKWNKYAYTINNPLRYFDPDGQEEIEVQLRAFIPQKTVSDPLGHTFAGDNRGFTSSQNVTSRTSITVRIETDSSIIPGNPIISVTQPGTAGQTQQLDKNGYRSSLCRYRYRCRLLGCPSDVYILTRCIALLAPDD